MSSNSHRAGTTMTSTPIHVWFRTLSTFLFWESKQETSNYMELTRVNDFTVRAFPVSERGNGNCRPENASSATQQVLLLFAKVSSSLQV